MISAWMFILQRASALVMGPFVIVHLGLIIYAMRGGLSAGEILSRTQGEIGWMAFYVLFVIAAAIHAPIGLRNVLAEMAGLRGRGVDIALGLFAIFLLVAGLRAVYAVTVP